MRRTVAIFTLALLGLSGLGTAWHEATERHVLCAAHGLPVEESAGPGASARSEAAPGSAVGASPSAAEHEHCAWAAVSRKDSVPSPADHATEIAPPPASRLFQPDEQEIDFAVVRTYELAPKTSPPVGL